MQKSVIEYLVATATKFPQKNAVQDSTGSITFSELLRSAFVIADEIKASLPEDSGELKRSMNLSRMVTDKRGYTYTKVQFVGYDEAKKSKQFPRGVPNAVKAASLESGNSRGQKGTHVISKAVKRSKEDAVKAMEKTLDEAIGKAMGE